MQNIDCTIDHFLFPKNGQPSESGYVIVSAKTSSQAKKDNPVLPSSFVIKGYLPGLSSGSHVSVSGEWKHDPKYGDFFGGMSYEDVIPTTVTGIRKYLAGGFLDGVGPELADRIVDKFGKDTLEVMDKNPERLKEVPGIGPKKMNAITESWREQQDMRDVMLFLKTYDVGNVTALKIFRKYGHDSISRIKENPYILAEESGSGDAGGVEGVGFRKADKIALSMGTAPDSPHRIMSALIYVLREETEKCGNVYTLHDDLVAKAKAELDAGTSGATAGLVSQGIAALRGKEEVKVEEKDGQMRVYLPVYWHSERGVAKRLIAKAADRSAKGEEIDFAALEKKCGIGFDEIQKDAIRLASGSGVCVITGGPGTGKTTTMKGVIAEAAERKLRVLLAAPTGRAAKRLSETTGMEAKTIHRLLEFNPRGGFGRDEDRPLTGDLLVVDEGSMVDLLLMYSLLKAVPSDMRLVLVGDADQLPSVGAGTVLRDVVASGAVPTVRLTRIFRQAQGSMIVRNAHAINRGDPPALPCNLTPGAEDFCFITREGDDTANVNGMIMADIVRLVSEYIPETYGYRPEQIQVLSPMRRGALGTEELNRRLQDVLNPVTKPGGGDSGTFMGKVLGESMEELLAPAKVLKVGAREFRMGDRVMQTKNNYDWDVFNGDMGTIVDVDPDERSMEVDFDGKRVRAEKGALDQLELAYACTIHKSQGSEYPVMILPVTMSHYVMLARNLVYTAVTRSKSLCVLIGSRKALLAAVGNDMVEKRNSALAERLADRITKND